MPNYTQGDTRITLTQQQAAAAQSNGSLVIDSKRTRPFWFDGRFRPAISSVNRIIFFSARQIWEMPPDSVLFTVFGSTHRPQMIPMPMRKR